MGASVFAPNSFPEVVLIAGASNSGTSSSVRYLYPWFNNSTVSSSEIAFPVPSDRVLVARTIRIRTNGAPAVGTGTITYTLFVDNVATAVTFSSVASSTPAGLYSATNFAVNIDPATQRCAIVVQCTGTVTTGSTSPVVAVICTYA